MISQFVFVRHRPYAPYAAGEGFELTSTGTLAAGKSYYVKSGKITVMRANSAGDTVDMTLWSW